MNVQADGAVRLGAGIVTEEAVLITHPWLSLGYGKLSLSLQAPLTTAFEQGKLRPREWDEVTDYGRILRFAQFGESIRIGPIEHRSLGFQTVMRRYYNGVDPDHYRVGLDVDLDGIKAPQWVPRQVSVIVDNLMAGPIVSSHFGWGLPNDLTMGIVTAVDTVFPNDIRLELDDEGWLRHDRQALGIYALEFGWAFYVKRTLSLSTYATVNTIDFDGLGGHLGLDLSHSRQSRWVFTGRIELMLLGPNYVWSPIDTGFLLDRWESFDEERETADSTIGGRGALQIEYGRTFLFGAEYADCRQSNRSDLSAWFSVPMDKVTITSFWRHRRPDKRIELFDPTEALTAFSASVKINPYLGGFFVLAREWRTVEESMSYAPSTSVSLMLEISPVPSH